MRVALSMLILFVFASRPVLPVFSQSQVRRPPLSPFRSPSVRIFRRTPSSSPYRPSSVAAGRGRRAPHTGRCSASVRGSGRAPVAPSGARCRPASAGAPRGHTRRSRAPTATRRSTLRQRVDLPHQRTVRYALPHNFTTATTVRRAADGRTQRIRRQFN